MLEFLLVVAIIIICALVYACWNMLKKNERLEDAINAYHARTWRTIQEMRMLDNKQMFEEDDEVGSVFKQLLECVNELDAFVTETVDGNSTTQEAE